jgi:MYXO-CTERM domain-containing protein
MHVPQHNRLTPIALTMVRTSTMSTSRELCSLALLGLLGAIPTPCMAEQFTLFDATFTYTKEDADNSSPSKSHYYVTDLNPAQPSDWTAPVDYRNGTVHIRTEVIDKPAGNEVTQWVLCYIPEQGQGNGYGCTGTGTYTEEGLYEVDVDMHSWWENESIVWNQGIKEMHLVMKDANGSTGFTHLRPDPEKFFPTTMRITMVQVSSGSTYDPSKVPELADEVVDAGTPEPRDAGTTPPGNGFDAGEIDEPPSSGDGGSSAMEDAGDSEGPVEPPPGTGDGPTAPPAESSGGCSLRTGSTGASTGLGVMVGLIAAAARRRRNAF